MHCRDCGYALWNLNDPRCPECGLAFDLRSYRFAPETVAFACPDCGNLHAGAGESYLPATSDAATCQACGRSMAVPRMRVVPLVPNPPDAVAFNLPWDDRASLGWWKAWWQTTKLAMLKPAKVVSQSRPGGTWGNSYLYAVTTYGVGLSVNAVLFGLIFAVAGVIDSGGSPDDLLVMLTIALVATAALLAYVFVVPLFAFVFTALPAHLFLWLFASERKGDLPETARFVNYAQAPMALMAIPLCGYHIGSNVGGIWVLVAAILMLRTVHGVSGLKASAAVLWLPLLFLILYVALIIFLVVYEIA